MKKFFVILASILVMIGVSSCNSCTREKNVNDSVLSEVVDSLGNVVVERMISLDRQSMYLNHSENYRWYETGVVLNDWLDGETDGSFNMVVNVFQVMESFEDGSFDTYVVKRQHVDGEVGEEAVHGFWVEDFPLNEEEINVTFVEAFEKVMEVNLPKPHTRQVVLRKQVGPVNANPQWIFGNLQAQIYVDAVTGEVSDKNPAFPVGFQYSFTW